MNPRSRMVGQSLGTDGKDAPIPPPLSLEKAPEPPTERTDVHVYGPHPNTENYIRFLKWLSSGIIFLILLIQIGINVTVFLIEGTLILPFTLFSAAVIALSFSYNAFVHWPRSLRSVKITLTDTHLQIERKVHRRKIVKVPRSSVTNVNLKIEKALKKYKLSSVYVYVRRRSLPWRTRLFRNRIRLFGLDRPGHLRKQLLEPTGSDEVVSLDGSAVVALGQEKPTWTRS